MSPNIQLARPARVLDGHVITTLCLFPCFRRRNRVITFRGVFDGAYGSMGLWDYRSMRGWEDGGVLLSLYKHGGCLGLGMWGGDGFRQ